MPRRSLHTRVETWPLKAPFRIAGHAWYDLPVLVVTISDNGVAGRGEGAGVYYLDDVPETMCVQVERLRGEIERGIDRRTVQTMLPPGGARNAVDCALWALEARRAGKPVWALAGLERPRPLVTTYTLSAESPETMAAGAHAYADVRALKLKLTGQPALDAERVTAVRRARPDAWLAVDANQGYRPDTLDELLPALIDAGVALLEQPFPRGRECDLDGLDSPIPIAADESVQDASDIENAARGCQVINIKLDKCGGLTEALLMIDEIRRRGLEPMVGNMLGTSLAMAPAFLVGQFCSVVDLDGPTLLARDRTPAVRYDQGMIDCTEAVWGLGRAAPVHPPRR